MKVTCAEWDSFITQHPNAHVLQTAAWGELKSKFGWEAVRLISGDCGAQILFKTLPGGLKVGYVPKGPVGHSCEIYDEIDLVSKEYRAIFSKIEPDHWEPEEIALLARDHKSKNSRPIQPQRTVVISLEGSDDDLLGRMKQKTRYNIRLAEKKGIEIESSGDIRKFHEITKITGQRDQFGVHSLSYYQTLFDLFHPLGNVELLFARFEGKTIAGVIVFSHGERAWYMYGASTDEERNRMPTYLLQWEAMKWAKGRGCKQYDLWGIPDLDEENLELEFLKKNSHTGLWGVYRFKRGFGGEILRSVGAWDRIYYPGLYKLYQQIMRIRGRQDE
jgi:peptidoglycan pentaglycine glycine transferase (the first glycine)